MKNIYLFAAISIFILCGISLNAQDKASVFFNAMNEEIQRSMSGLKLEKMTSPQFISYSISDAQALQIRASMGGIVKSELNNVRKFENKVLVGDNGKTQENYLDENNIWEWSEAGNNVVQSLNKEAIRRCLWLATDENYKKGVTNYEAKLSALSQQSLSEEERQLPDFSNAAKSEKLVEANLQPIDKLKMEDLAKKLSAIFNKYPDIQTSATEILAYSGMVYFMNSQGSKVKYPYEIIAVRITAKTQAPGGETLNDHTLFFANNANELPQLNNMLSDVEKMAQNLTALTKAPMLSEPYCGPVLFEGEASAEAVVQKFFSSANGLISVRKPLIGSPQVAQFAGDKIQENALEAMLNKKIVSRDFTLESTPFLKSFQGTQLVGSFQVDAEGIIPNEKLSLVENGVLKNLICGRIPSLKMKQSNGHARPALNNGAIKTCYGPGVIQFKNTNATTTLDKIKMKEKLLAAAKEEDLEYAYIVRKVVSDAANIKEEGEINFFGSSKKKPEFSQAIQVYRVKVSDGSEELVRGAEIQGISIKAFKRILATSNSSFAYNTMLKPVSGDLSDWEFRLTGFPASFIVPDGILFQELDIVKEKQNVVKKVPLVANPLGRK